MKALSIGMGELSLDITAEQILLIFGDLIRPVVYWFGIYGE
jgi:hypothetical protein